jgi:type II secretion system protein H
VTPPDRAARAGFSLLELLVALAVVGLFVSVVALTVSFGRDESREAVDALAMKMARAESEAVATGRFTGLRLDPGGTGYAFMEHVDGEWRELRGHPSLRGADFGADLVLALDGAPPRRAGLLRLVEDEEAVRAPDIWFDPTGLTESFVLTAQGRERRFRIAWLESGGPRVSEVD